MDAVARKHIQDWRQIINTDSRAQLLPQEDKLNLQEIINLRLGRVNNDVFCSEGPADER